MMAFVFVLYFHASILLIIIIMTTLYYPFGLKHEIRYESLEDYLKHQVQALFAITCRQSIIFGLNGDDNKICQIFPRLRGHIKKHFLVQNKCYIPSIKTTDLVWLAL